MKQIYIVIFSAALLILAGCSRHIDSQDVPFDLPAQPPVPDGLQIVHTNSGLNLSWQISDTSVVRYFKIYSADSANGEYILLDSLYGFSISLGGLTDGKVYFFKVSAVVKGPVEGAMSSTIATRPGIMAVSINNDDKYTRTQSVTLTFVVPVTANLVQVATDSTFAGAQWQTFSPSISGNLTSGDGTKRIYARFQFADGSQSDKGVADSIILDTRAFIDSTYFTTSVPNPKAGDAATFFVVTHESGGTASVSFANVSRLPCFDDGSGGDVTANDGIYTRRFVIPPDLEVTDGLVTGNFQDAAGNAADPRVALKKINIVQTNLPPTAVRLASQTDGTSTILTWTVNTDTDFGSYQIYRDTLATVTDSTSRLLSVINSQGTTTFTDTRPDNTTKFNYRVYVFDEKGLFAGSNQVSAP